jgi:Xaa-Pro aminopeptidase
MINLDKIVMNNYKATATCKALRELITKHHIDGYIVPSTDEFNNEYVPIHLKRLQYITGFTGSNGVGLILRDYVALFTDGRYLLQASLELGNEFLIFDTGSDKYKEFFAKLKGYIIGFDPNLLTQLVYSCYDRLAHKYGIILKAIDTNLVDEIWVEKPQLQASKIIELGLEFVGKTREDKIKEVVAVFSSKADYLLISSPDSVCWLLNLRSNDIEYTPFLLSYALIDKLGNIELFLDKNNHKFKLNGVNTRSFETLKTRYQELIKANQKISIDLKNSSYWFFINTPAEQLVSLDDPCRLLKACKNSVEVEGFRQCHIQDGIAVCKFLGWLENNIDGDLDEIKASDKLLEFRQQRSLFQYPSFASISAFASNGAIVHYHPKPESNKVITQEGLYLIDSGGQYLNGTTDITRVTCFGNPSPEQIRNFTLVLKGHIQLAKAIFPEGTTGLQLDALARSSLWKDGKDYEHGTGHGVGHFLSVHEGPQRIGKNYACNVPLKVGMVVSNEPGFYKKEEYGIRIENLLLVKETNYKGFLEFETLTLVPIDQKLIDSTLLTEDERLWINDYHANIRKKIATYLDPIEKNWLSEKTKPIK